LFIGGTWLPVAVFLIKSYGLLLLLEVVRIGRKRGLVPPAADYAAAAAIIG
jgi:hypothetical protein